MKNAFEYEAELAALREELARTNATFVNATQVENEKWVKHLADAERLLTRARIYARDEFRDEIDACLKELNQ